MKTPTLSPAECADELERMAVAANVINWPKAAQDACTAAAHHLRAQAAEIERMRGALHTMVFLAEPQFSDKTQMQALRLARAALAPTQAPT